MTKIKPNPLALKSGDLLNRSHDLLPFDKRKAKKVLSLKSLDAKLWRIFSRFIRLRDATKAGVTFCISCGELISVFYYEYEKVKFNQQCHAGHYYNRGSNYRALKYDEKNVNAQCAHCNKYLEGNKQGYEKGLIKKYGESVLGYLDLKKRNQTSLNRFVLESLIRHYEIEVKKLMKEKIG